MGDLLKFPTGMPISSPTVAREHAVVPGEITVWESDLERFTLSLRASARSAGTVRIRHHYLSAFARDHPDPMSVTRTDVDRWLASRPYGVEALKSAQTTLRLFYAWLYDSNGLGRSPLESLPPVRVPRGLPRPLPDAIYRTAMESAPWRIRVMMALGRQVGLRCVEIAAVHSHNLLDDGLHVTGKGGHQRVVPIDDAQLRAAIANAGGYLFPGRERGHLSPLWISKVISRQLPDGWTAHSLRHAFGTAAYRANPDLLALAELMGHANLDTTRRYAAVAGDRLREVARGAAPSNPPRLERASWERGRAAA